ncbi:E3 ubiquitin-protein ligase MBR2-like isoform X1 [Miscanthus floridulus]|uniref:E3 ubiquitin-protein ligase MBR2-like isoform X1 n=2 Tax=Miscanthus floridulus TaxID=154761 RepID=UPI00345B3AB5
MEEYSDRRSKAEIAYLRRGSRLSSRNQSSEERTNHSIDKPVSSTRFNPMKARIGDNQERPRYVHDSFKSSSSKVAPASSSKFPLSKFEERRRQPFGPGFDIAESSRRKADAKRLEGSKKIVVDNESSDTLQGESEGFTTEQVPYPEGSHFTVHSGVSAHTVKSLVQTASLSSRTQTQKHKEVNMGTPGASSSSMTNGSTIPRSSTMGLRPAYGHVSGGQIRGLKNLGCTSVPDAQPSGCPSESVISRRFEFMRKRAFNQESSSRSRNLSLGHSPPTDIRSTGHRIRMNEQSLSQQIPRRSSRNQESAVSVRTRRPSPHATRMSVPDEREDGMLSLHESSTRNVQPAQEHLSLEEVSTESSIRPFFVEFDNNIFSSSRRHCSNTRAERGRPSSLFEESPRQMFHSLMGERDSHRHITMEGITEVLVALERIEQQAELTYDQLLVLETNLFLGAFASYDRHRDMRMDIDNMSYEELLALEERIGSVSTALSEEQFTKCLRRSIYSQVASDVNKSTVDDMKCSICQEEYMEGEEVGRLPCEHRFHVCCIGQWLGQKNWCPVCKASAVPSKG